ncbi:MAG: calcium-binding protein [Geminicoccaceae bacterium]
MDLDDVLDAAGAALPNDLEVGDRTVGGSGNDRIRGTNGDDEIYADPVPTDDRGGDDQVWGLAGDDVIRAFGGDNRLDGGPGDDELITADGRDVIFGGAGDDEIQGGRETDQLYGGPGNDEIRGGEGDDTLRGGAGDDRVIGSSGNDLLFGGLGADQLEGREGTDRFAWSTAKEGRDTVLDFEAGSDGFLIGDFLRGHVSGVGELARHVRFSPTGEGGVLQVDADGRGPGGWHDLALLPGQGGLRAEALYLAGDLELAGQPAAPAFSSLTYIASYGDLIDALGADTFAGKRHFIRQGYGEGRAATFDAEQYLANYADLRTAFGHDHEAAARHFITYGYEEGRTDHPLATATDFML